MNGLEIVMLLAVVRVIIPFGMLILIGELLHRKETQLLVERRHL